MWSRGGDHNNHYPVLNNVETSLVNNKPIVQHIGIKSVLVEGVGMEGIRPKTLATYENEYGIYGSQVYFQFSDLLILDCVIRIKSVVKSIPSTE